MASTTNIADVIRNTPAARRAQRDGYSRYVDDAANAAAQSDGTVEGMVRAISRVIPAGGYTAQIREAAEQAAQAMRLTPVPQDTTTGPRMVDGDAVADALRVVASREGISAARLEAVMVEVGLIRDADAVDEDDDDEPLSEDLWGQALDLLETIADAAKKIAKRVK